MSVSTRRWWSGLLLGALVAVGLVALPATAQAAPSGFSLEAMPFAGLVEPVGVEFAVTGQVFMAERRGVIKVYDNLDDATSRTVADLRLRVFNGGDRGLLGLALDPQYPTRPYLWALYAKNAEVGGTAPKYGSGLTDTDTCPDGAANDCRVAAELTRLTLNPTDGTWTGAESVLLNGWCQQFGSHSVGTVAFGTDGYLYVSSGDGASYNAVDVGNQGSERCSDPAGTGGALRSQSVRRPAGTAAVLNGTVLRLDPTTGGPAPGNPYAGDPDPIRQRVLAYGLRNPYRMAPRPGTNEMWVGDVGWGSWEELNRIDVDATAENFGWPCYEGNGRQNAYEASNQGLCQSLYAAGPSAVTSPQLGYNHGSQLGAGCPSGSSSISAVAFPVGATAYPAAYRGGVFFSDYSRQCLWYATLTGSAITPGSAVVFDNTAFPADLKPGPNGDIYLVDIVSSQVKRIRYTAGGNTPPIPIARATPSSGPTPLNVQLDGSGSSDPDAGSSLTYAWDLDGDGAYDDSTAVSPTWTYTAQGTVTARLRVTDNLGEARTTSITINPGSAAPTVTVASPATTQPWKVGDTVPFTVMATDPEDGPLAASRITTKLVIKHCPGGANCHEHVQQTFAGVASGSFVAPDHEYPCWVELQASATDSSGIVSTTTLRLDPATVNITVNTAPTGLKAILGAADLTTPFTVPVIQGSSNTLAVASPQTSGLTYTFASWSDGGAVSHDIVANASTSYTASFTSAGGLPPVAGLVGAWSFSEGIGSVAGDSSGQNNTGTLEGGPTWTTAGRYGGALIFDGVNDRVSVADRASLDLTTAGTMTAWVRPTTLRSWQQVLLKEKTGGLAYSLYAPGGATNRPNVSVAVGGPDQAVDGTAALAVNTWTHLAATYDGATLRLYVNGTQVSSRALTGTLDTSAQPLRIGGNDVWGEWFSGQLDEVRVYDRALTPAEVVTDSTTAGTADTVPPTIPTGLSATGGVATVNLSWTASTDIVAIPTYEVHRSLVSGFSPSAATRIAAGVTTTTYADGSRPAGTYYYRVIASDGANLSAPSAQTSAVVTGDTSPPSVPGSVTVTQSGATAILSWAASTDNVSVTAYEVLRDGQAGSTTFTVTAPTTTLTDAGLGAGTFTYSVRARDHTGNRSAYSATRSVTVQADVTPPTVSVTAPAAGATVSGSVNLAATATDDVGVVGVQFRVDGVAVGAEDTSTPYAVAWTSSGVANGAHTVTAVARDASGKSTTSAPVSVTLTNTGPSGLVGAWSFNAGSPTTAVDSSGRGNTGTLVNGTVWTASGKFGGALTFDGTNDHVSVPDSASLDLTSAMTVSAWVRPTTLGSWRTVVMKERPGGLSYALYGTGATGNRPNGQISIGGVDREVNASGAVTANAWVHAAMTYDGTTMRMYVNGAQVGTRAQTGSAAVSASMLRIGGNSVWGEWFAGQIDEVRVYNRALTAAEVVTVRDAPL